MKMLPSGPLLGDLFAEELNTIQEYHNFTRFYFNQPTKEENITLIKQHLDTIIGKYQSILGEFHVTIKPKITPVNMQPILIQQPHEIQHPSVVFLPSQLPISETMHSMQTTSYLSFSTAPQFAPLITYPLHESDAVTYALTTGTLSSNTTTELPISIPEITPNAKLPIPPMQIIPLPKQQVNEPKNAPRKSVRAKHQSCTSCSTLTTAQWRSGPAGPRTLCNRCGLRYAKSKRTQSNKNSPPSPSPGDDVDKLIN
jgi:hypothetical protein